MKTFLLVLFDKVKGIFKKGVSYLETSTNETDPITPETSRRFSVKSFLIGLLLGLLLAVHSCSCARADCVAARNLEDVHAASCRVFAIDASGRGAIGTGTVCGLFNNKYYVLTNWHVVENHRTVTLQFFGTGRITECKGAVIATWHNENQPYDFAIITVDRASLAQYDPPFVPLGKRGTRPTTGGPILSSGCSEGRWPFAWKGSIESYYGETAQFFPAPKGGQSGSAIVEELDGRLYITGILTWRVGDERQLSEEDMRGGAIPIAKLYEAFDGKNRTGLPNSVPPYSVWCREETDGENPPEEPASEPVTEAVEESKEEPAEKPATEPASESAEKPATESAVEKDEAVIHVEPETAPVELPKKARSERLYRHAIGNTEDFQKPVAQKEIVEVIMFTSTYCQPCQQAKPVIADLTKQGYVIHVVDVDNDSGRKMAFERNVTSTPTFVIYRSPDNRATWTEVSRFSGATDLKERLLQSFSLGNSGGNTLREEPREIAPDTGSLEPLFDEYGSGSSGWFRNRPRKEEPPEFDDDESGLFRSDNGGIFRALRADLRAFLASILARCALLITLFWFGMYLLLALFKKLLGLLPKFSVQVKSDSTASAAAATPAETTKSSKTKTES